jgi:hypothetical protein
MNCMIVSSPTLQLLAWIDEREPTHAETMEAWHSHCPRLTVWEDALADRLVQVVRSRGETRVIVTARGLELIQ